MSDLPAFQRETQRLTTESVDCKALRFEKGLPRWLDCGGVWPSRGRKRTPGDTTRNDDLESKRNQPKGNCAANRIRRAYTSANPVEHDLSGGSSRSFAVIAHEVTAEVV